MPGIFGLLTQALEVLLGDDDDCLRAISFSLICCLLAGQMLELVTWSPFLQLLQKDWFLQSTAEWSSPRQLEHSFGPLHLFLQSLVLQVEQMFLLILWCISLSAERIVPSFSTVSVFSQSFALALLMKRTCIEVGRASGP